MKKTTILSLFFSVSCFISSSFAQVPDSTYYKRLYMLGKVWGYAKYFHSAVAAGGLNWDNELITAIHGCKNAPTDSAFNDSLMLLLNTAGTMVSSGNFLWEVPDSLNNNNDLGWIDNLPFSDPVRTALDTIRSKFRPQTNTYVGQAFTDGNPTFDNDQQYYSGNAYPTEELRILALFRYWNIIDYFYPYKKIMDRDWDSVLVEFIPQIVTANNALSYNLYFKKLTTQLSDTHAFFVSSAFNNWDGNYYPPFEARYIENEMVITKVVNGINNIHVGNVIKAIDGVPIKTLRDSLRNYSFGSNNAALERNLNELVLWGPNGSSNVTLDSGSGSFNTTFIRNSSNYTTLSNMVAPKTWWDTTLPGGCTVGVVDMGLLQQTDVQTMFNDLGNKDAIVFDIRNYPNGTMWYIVNYIYSSHINVGNFTTPDITYPGRLYWSYDWIGSGTATPYKGKIVLLFDERTQSQAEFTCMGLSQFPGCKKFGSTTAGADGNVSLVYLPGNIQTYFTGLGTFYSDYTPTQRIGIVPDVVVLPTIKGIRSGKDEVLEYALNCSVLHNQNFAPSKTLLYPNPANDVLYIATPRGAKHAISITIRNAEGQTILRKSLLQDDKETISLENIPNGLYFAVLEYADGISTSKFWIQH